MLGRTRCRICHTDLHDGRDLSACSSCGLEHHKDCFEGYGKCTSDQCTGYRSPWAAEAPPALNAFFQLGAIASLGALAYGGYRCYRGVYLDSGDDLDVPVGAFCLICATLLGGFFLFSINGVKKHLPRFLLMDMSEKEEEGFFD